MKHTITGLVATLGLALCAQQAGALPIDIPTYQDIDEYWGEDALGNPVLGVLLNAANPSQAGTFDIRARPSDGSPSVTIAGNPANANAYLNAGTTYNDILGFEPGSWERVVSANAFFYLRNASDDNDVFSIDLTDFVTGSIEGQGTLARFILGGSMGSVALDVLNNNGYLDYAVARESGSFRFDYAQLQVVLTGAAPPSQVPDGGSTAGLLGFALLGLGTVARRLKAK